VSAAFGMGSGGAGLRIVLIGATGALGTEVVSTLGASSLPISELALIATDRSIGNEFEFRGDLLYVAAETPPFQTADLVICCAPKEVAPEVIRNALRAEVPCIDCSAALAGAAEVPLVVSDVSSLADIVKPVVGTPSGTAIGWAFVLHALRQVATLERVVGTVLQSAAHAGSAGIDVLSSETIALLSQDEPNEPHLFAAPIAFDCLPSTGAPGDDGATSFEDRLRSDLGHLLGGDLQIAVTGVQVPTFVGEGSTLSIRTDAPLSVGDALAALEKAPGVELRESAPSTRDATGNDDVLVGRVRRDPSCPQSLQLWAATDGVHLAAANVVKLIETRLRLN
jgi:aspartate-semialdehyde dehydrogenase